MNFRFAKFSSIFFGILLTVIIGCEQHSIDSRCGEDSCQCSEYQENIERLWGKTVSALLMDDLWEISFKYDASHVLMLPMDYAFSCNSKSFLLKQTEFHAFFLRNFSKFENSFDDNRLNNTQYLYFVTRYLKQAYASGAWTDRHFSVEQKINEFIDDFWNRGPAWLWGHDSFEGVKTRLEWKLSNFETAKSYYRAIFDEELFTFGIAAELASLTYLKREAPSELVLDILKHADFVFKDEVQFIDTKRWLFQPGVWADYYKYQYAGHDQLIEGLAIFPVSDISTDSSHAHRYPLILISLKNASKYFNEESYQYYETLIEGLTLLFEKTILNSEETKLGGPTMNNYTNGLNGLFQYDPLQSGVYLGYGPSQLSGTLTLGWYSYLDSARFKAQIRSTSFPLNEQLVELYTGRHVARNRHYLLTWPEYFNNGFAELYFLISSADWKKS